MALAMKGMRRSVLALSLLLVFRVAMLAGAQDETPPVELRLLTHNMHVEREILDPMLDMIREADADIVALQEVSRTAYERLIETFADDYAYYAPDLETGPVGGVALLSRYEMLELTLYSPETMRLLRAVLNIAGRPVTVFSVHPVSPGSTNYNFDPRGEEIAFLLGEVAKETNPVLMLGDFNTEEWSDDYAALTADFSDAYRTLYPEQAGPTYPDYSQPQARVNARLPRWTPLVLRIDYIFYDDNFSATEARVWPRSTGSDHRPLLATLQLQGG